MIDGIHHVYVETHNWGKSVAFWQVLGYTLDEDHGTSGILRPSGVGQPYLYLAEVPPDHRPTVQLYVNVAYEFDPPSPVEATEPWADSHWGTRVLKVQDPDGREHTLQVTA